MDEIEELIILYPERKNQILRMYSKNHLMAKDKSGIITNDTCLDVLGEDKVNLISCFPDISNQVVKLDTKTLKLIEKLIERYEQINESSEWTYLFSDILKNISEYDVLLGSIEEEKIDVLDEKTLDNLTSIMIEENTYDISNIEHVIEYQKIKNEKCKNTFENSNDFEKKIDMVLISKYGISKKYVKDLLERFGEDIESIKDEKLKSYFNNIRYIYNLPENDENSDKLTQIMQKSSVDSMSVSDGFNRISLDKRLKKSYMELYINRGFFSISDGIPMNTKDENITTTNQNVYELPFDENGVMNFNILIHDVDVGLDRGGNIEDYYKHWNRCEMNSPHICASYIRRDCLRKSGNGVSFGFNNVTKDDVVSISPTDSYSNGVGLITSATDRFCAPDNQIRKTGMIDNHNYNEIDIRRFIEKDGELEPRQPDYMIIYKNNGKIPKLSCAQKASEDFEKHTGKKLPILIIDRDKCIETELLQIASLQIESEKNPTEELAIQIKNKKEMLLREDTDIKFMEDSINAYQICLMQSELKNHPTNNALREKIEIAKQNYINKLISQGRMITDTILETDQDMTIEGENKDVLDQNSVTERTDEVLDEDFEWVDETDSWNNSWDDEVSEDEIIESFNKLINKKDSVIKEYAERRKDVVTEEKFLTEELIRKVARSEGVPLKKEFCQQDFYRLENMPEINREVKSFDES